MSYIEDVKSDAISTVQNFMDEIIEQVMNGDEASDDLRNDYSGGDRYHHENHIDREYDLEEAASLLRELRDHKETDSGLWEGLEPEKAISAQAAYTYGNAVYGAWCELIEEINEDSVIEALRDSVVGEMSDCDEALKKIIKERVEYVLAENE